LKKSATAQSSMEWLTAMKSCWMWWG